MHFKGCYPENKILTERNKTFTNHIPLYKLLSLSLSLSLLFSIEKNFFQKSNHFSLLEIQYQHKRVVRSRTKVLFDNWTTEMLCPWTTWLRTELFCSRWQTFENWGLTIQVYLYINMYIKYVNIYIYIVTIWPCNSTLMYTYWKELKTYVHIKMRTKMLTEVLFIVAPKWKQPKCLSTNKWIKQNVYDG